jgi:hypothetical protein
VCRSKNDREPEADKADSVLKRVEAGRDVAQAFDGATSAGSGTNEHPCSYPTLGHPFPSGAAGAVLVIKPWEEVQGVLFYRDKAFYGLIADNKKFTGSI